MTERRKKRMLVTLLISAGCTGLLAAVYIFSLVDDWGRDFTQNHARLDSAAKSEELHPITTTLDRETLSKHVQSWVEDQPHWDMIQRDAQGSESHIHLTRTTGLVRYVDDIHITISDTSEGVLLEAESKSRVGKGDLGQNPRNLKELTRGIRNLMNAET